jgi:hypothetical protein
MNTKEKLLLDTQPPIPTIKITAHKRDARLFGRKIHGKNPPMAIKAELLETKDILFLVDMVNMTMAPTTNARKVIVVCVRPNRPMFPFSIKSCTLMKIIAKGKAKK